MDRASQGEFFAPAGSAAAATGGGGYTRMAVFLHWLVAALLLLQFPLGWLMQEIPKEPPGVRAEAFNLHKSFGLVLLGLVIARLGWRLTHPPPAPPNGTPRWQVRLAQGNHALLYVLVFGLAITGYLGSAVSGYPVRFFGVTLPSWAGRHPELKEMLSVAHLTLSWTLLAAFALHLAGAVTHALQARTGVAGRMR